MVSGIEPEEVAKEVNERAEAGIKEAEKADAVVPVVGPLFKVSRGAKKLMAEKEINIVAVAAFAELEPGGNVNVNHVKAFIKDQTA